MKLMKGYRILIVALLVIVGCGAPAAQEKKATVTQKQKTAVAQAGKTAVAQAGKAAVAQAGKADVYAVGFYNLENLFDTIHDQRKNDYEFLPDGTNKWTSEKYTHKLRNMARVLADIGTDKVAGGCAAIGVAEVENARCLRDLCAQKPLKTRDIRYVHVEGPDNRGIDCALLYNPRLFKVRNVKLVPYVYVKPEDADRATRGFLVVSGTMGGEHVTIVVNHLPSRGAPSFAREEGGRQLRIVKDSLLRDDPGVKLLIMGDMNDDPQDRSMAVSLGAKRHVKDVESPGGLWNPWWDVLAKGTGTLTYQGAWNLFDQIIVSSSLLDREGTATSLKLWQWEVFRRDYLLQQHGRYRGSPFRTFSGGNWIDGYSDHLPTVVYLRKVKKSL